MCLDETDFFSQDCPVTEDPMEKAKPKLTPSCSTLWAKPSFLKLAPVTLYALIKFPGQEMSC